MTIIMALLLVAVGVVIAEIYNYRIRRAERRGRGLRGAETPLAYLPREYRASVPLRWFDEPPREAAPPKVPPWLAAEIRENGRTVAIIKNGRWDRP